METYSDYVRRTEPRMKPCPECEGEGISNWQDTPIPEPCDRCEGTGYVEDDNQPDPDERHDERKVEAFIRWQSGKAMDY